ncbi:response regulator transcription factor [Emticicia sp. SJ17W-69]|uniref:response regulator transcription factor n=1 Tax=Emticicia sp. SJ17W-69 TaxID=3421657 RepID=UPI003EBE3231
MIFNRKTLQPVKRDDFFTIVNRDAVINEPIQPEAYFSPLIEHIKKFAVGQYFWFVANLLEGKTCLSAGMSQQIIGVPLDTLVSTTFDTILNRIHPDDLSQMFAFTNQWIQILNNVSLEQKRQLHPTIYIRQRNHEERYKWTMVKYADHIFDEEGNVIYAFTLVTDISHIKTEGPAMMSIIDSEDEVCQHFFCSTENGLFEAQEYTTSLTKREIEILNQLSIGLSSKQIASELNISIKTVDNHRQNMLQKTNSKSTGELISYAIKSGYL